MKNLISASKALKTINAYGKLVVLIFDKGGNLNHEYSGVNLLEAFEYMMRQLHSSMGRKVLIADKATWEKVSKAEQEGYKVSAYAYEDCKSYQIDSLRINC